MIVYLTLFCFIIYLANASPRSDIHWISNEVKVKSLPVIDALITRLDDERWMDDDEPCLRKTLDMLRGVKNNTLWATWVWDSMQPPGGIFYGSRYHIGNYDQCLEVPWSAKHPDLRTQYCLVDVKSQGLVGTRELGAFDSADDYLRAPTKDGRVFNEIFFAVCLFAECSSSAVAKISRHLHQLSHLPDGEVFVNPRDCQRAGETAEYSRGFYIFWSVVGMLLATAALSTFFNREDGEHNSLNTVKKSFCLKRNYNALFRMNNGEIKVMNGMRVITAATTVCLHVAFFVMQCPLVNGLTLEKILMHTKLGLALFHLEVAVDSFFAMSGLLHIRGLMMGRQRNILRILVKRYIRLIGPLALTTLLISIAFVDMGSGPYWKRANSYEVDVCATSWWKNILMVNNDTETLCQIVSWYVSCDFQLTILATFLFYLYRRNRKLGVTAFALVAVAVTLNLALTVYWKQLDILPFGIKIVFELRKYNGLNYTYLTSYSRAGSYLVGMVMGYIVATYNPGHYRKVINKKWSLIIIIASLSIMAIVLFVGAIFDGRPYDPLEAAVVVATNRVFWAVAVCCIIGACEYGSVPLINHFLSWPGFVPLAKLSYGIYLLHPFIIQKKVYSARSPATFGLYSVISDAPGVVLLGYAASLIMYLILEAPLINISNALLDDKSKSSEQNSIKEESHNTGNEGTYKNGRTKYKIF